MASGIPQPRAGDWPAGCRECLRWTKKARIRWAGKNGAPFSGSHHRHGHRGAPFWTKACLAWSRMASCRHNGLIIRTVKRQGVMDHCHLRTVACPWELTQRLFDGDATRPFCAVLFTEPPCRPQRNRLSACEVVANAARYRVDASRREAVIPARKGRTNPQPHNPERYKARNAVERDLGWLKGCRLVAPATTNMPIVAWVFCTWLGPGSGCNPTSTRPGYQCGRHGIAGDRRRCARVAGRRGGQGGRAAGNSPGGN